MKTNKCLPKFNSKSPILNIPLLKTYYTFGSVSQLNKHTQFIHIHRDFRFDRTQRSQHINLFLKIYRYFEAHNSDLRDSQYTKYTKYIDLTRFGWQSSSIKAPFSSRKTISRRFDLVETRLTEAYSCHIVLKSA